MPMSSLLNKINLLVRSLLFEILVPITAMFYCIILLIAWPLTPLHTRFQLVIYWTYVAVGLLKILCHIDYQVEGLENIPKDRTGIIMCKHQSTWETYFLPRFFHDMAIIAKKELAWIPFFGWALATISPILINRSNTSSAMAQITRKGKKALDAGRWILVFPEGTRTTFGKPSKYRLGGARLAVNTGYPIIPVAHNAGYFWPRRTLIKKPGTIRVVIGPVIEVKNRTPEEVLEETQQWIEKTMVQITEKMQNNPP